VRVWRPWRERCPHRVFTRLDERQLEVARVQQAQGRRSRPLISRAAADTPRPASCCRRRIPPRSRGLDEATGFSAAIRRLEQDVGVVVGGVGDHQVGVEELVDDRRLDDVRALSVRRLDLESSLDRGGSERLARTSEKKPLAGSGVFSEKGMMTKAFSPVLHDTGIRRIPRWRDTLGWETRRV
jgi:hypothetical protein